MTDNKIIIGTRGSQLALYQAHKVQDILNEAFPNFSTEVRIIKTKGDKILDVALSKIGDKGLFTKELEVELLNGGIDLAVHSLKDLPTQLPSEFKVAAVLERANFRDAFVSKNGLKISELTAEHTVATSSLRRIANLRRVNKDVKIVDIRGNVNTRLQKMEDGLCDGMIMATAGLQRLELDQHITEILDPTEFIPAVAQGAIAIETASSNTQVNDLLKQINHAETEIEVDAERAFMRTLEGGCQVPVGAYSSVKGDQITLTGFVASLDGKSYLKESATASIENSKELGENLANKLVNLGATTILNQIRENL
ncbi:hydroxymethylbilane synthase [Saccharicrinis aurantiacus]|uniref:hydroxymethylbilane synthase n=1 Tax=Saccharicrinis aurantiacus TaxID=1849719 RepID=UPI000839AC2C|nr:hydroxymethylbilane synthase [Saccharicrinis aurantiacus]